MHLDLPRTLHRNIPALDRDIRTARRRQTDLLRRGPVNMRMRTDHIHLIARLHCQRIGLRLKFDRILRGDELQAKPTLSRCAPAVARR